MLINYTKLLKIKCKRKKRKRDSRRGPAASGLVGLVATRAAQPTRPPLCGPVGLPRGAWPRRPSSRGPTTYKRVTVRVWTLTALFATAAASWLRRRRRLVTVGDHHRRATTSSHHHQAPPPLPPLGPVITLSWRTHSRPWRSAGGLPLVSGELQS
jgi:hypothetical protein